MVRLCFAWMKSWVLLLYFFFSELFVHIFLNWKLHLFHTVLHGTYSTVCEFSLCVPNGISEHSGCWGPCWGKYCLYSASITWTEGLSEPQQVCKLKRVVDMLVGRTAIQRHIYSLDKWPSRNLPKSRKCKCPTPETE